MIKITPNTTLKDAMVNPMAKRFYRKTFSRFAFADRFNQFGNYGQTEIQNAHNRNSRTS
ncbi:MAG: hypothetical protein ACLR5R_09135 [Eubacterium sp.]|uniref:hypothetical protein n=1 Tax=Eubacterium sp. TaxID=142586 RepID=UPI0039A1B1FB